MLMLFPGIKQEYVLVLDTEYEDMKLLQCAVFLFKRISDGDGYQLAASFNKYIKAHSVNKYTTRYTGLTSEFLMQHGIEKDYFADFYDSLFEGIDTNDVIFVSHGTKGDRKVLKDAGVTFSPGHSFCTYKNAKRILKRERGLALTDVAAEAGFQLNGSHNAYYDAIATAVAFSFLTKLDYEGSV